MKLNHEAVQITNIIIKKKVDGKQIVLPLFHDLSFNQTTRKYIRQNTLVTLSKLSQFELKKKYRNVKGSGTHAKLLPEKS